MGLPQLAISVIKLIVSNKSLIINQILDLLKKFERGCPVPSELERIIKIRNEIVELLTQMRDEINKVNVIIKPLNETLPILDTTISILKLIPIPTAIGGVGVPMNVPIVYGDILAIPFFGLLVVYFYNIKNKSLLEYILFCFSILGFLLDILYTYIFFSNSKSSKM